MIAATKKVIKVLMITRKIIQSRNPTSELTNANKTQFRIIIINTENTAFTQN